MAESCGGLTCRFSKKSEEIDSAKQILKATGADDVSSTGESSHGVVKDEEREKVRTGGVRY